MLKQALGIVIAGFFCATGYAHAETQSSIRIDDGRVNISIKSAPSTIVYSDGLTVIAEGGIAAPSFPKPESHRFIRDEIVGYRGGLDVGVDVFNVAGDVIRFNINYKSCDLVKEVCFPPKQEVIEIPKSRLDTHVESNAKNEVFAINELDTLRYVVSQRGAKKRNPFLILTERDCLKCNMSLTEVLPSLPDQGMDIYVFKDAFSPKDAGYLADLAEPKGIMVFKMNNNASVIESIGGIDDKKGLKELLL